MLRGLVLLLASVLCAPALAAAEAPVPPRETFRVSAGTGAGTVAEIVKAFVGTIGAGFAGYDTRWSNRREVVLRVDRDLGTHGRLGLSYAYVGWDEQLLNGGAEVGRFEDRIHTVLAHGFLRWVDGEHFELYSGLGLGLSNWKESGVLNGERRSSSGNLTAWQLHLVGIGAGNAWLRLFAELGFGFEGLGVVGLVARF